MEVDGYRTPVCRELTLKGARCSAPYIMMPYYIMLMGHITVTEAFWAHLVGHAHEQGRSYALDLLVDSSVKYKSRKGYTKEGAHIVKLWHPSLDADWRGDYHVLIGGTEDIPPMSFYPRMLKAPNDLPLLAPDEDQGKLPRWEKWATYLWLAGQDLWDTKVERRWGPPRTERQALITPIKGHNLRGWKVNMIHPAWQGIIQRFAEGGINGAIS